MQRAPRGQARTSRFSSSYPCGASLEVQGNCSNGATCPTLALGGPLAECSCAIWDVSGFKPETRSAHYPHLDILLLCGGNADLDCLHDHAIIGTDMQKAEVANDTHRSQTPCQMCMKSLAYMTPGCPLLIRGERTWNAYAIAQFPGTQGRIADFRERYV